MVLGEVITMVGFAAAPSDSNLSLVDSVLNPIETHVDGLGALDFGASVGKAVGGRVVCGDWCWVELWSTEFQENLTEVDGFLAVVKEGSNFSFGGCCHDVLHDSTLYVDWPIGLGVVCWFILVAQVKVTSNSGPGLGFTQVGGITVDIQYHVTSVEADGCIGVGCCIVEELHSGIHSFLSALALGGCHGA